MSSSRLRLLSGPGIPLLMVLSAAPLDAAEYGDPPVYRLIEKLRPIAQAIQIDGNGNDWAGIPEFSDVSGDAGGDASRDIVKVAIAPLSDAWLVRIETAGPPSTQDLAFWMYIDYRGQERLDIELGLYLNFPDVLWRYPEGQPAVFSNWDHTVTVFGNVIEARIPLPELAAELPAEMAADLMGAGARSWIRITPFTRDSNGNILDYGAAVGSYRLLPTPYPLDPDLPVVDPNNPPDPPVALPPALDGIQYVGQAAGGIGTHSNLWGYDLFRVDQSLHPDNPHPGTQNTEYFSFGDPIRAPANGSVFSLDKANPDLAPRPNPCNFQPPNFVFLDIGNSIGVLFSHLMQGSIPLNPGDTVNAGDTLGNVGHSGSCSWAHLHLEAQSIDNGFASRPIEFTDVEVGLNPVDADPWLRLIKTWGIREGFLVRPARNLCPGVPLSAGGQIFCDGFESGDTSRWSKSQP